MNSEAVSSTSLRPRLLAGAQGLGQQVPQEVHLDAALAHLRHELVVLVLGALDPEHVVEQQVVVVRRREPLQAQLRPVHHHLAQRAHLGVDSERRHLSSIPIACRGSRGGDLGARCAVDDLLDLASVTPMAGTPPGRLDEAAGGVDLGPIDPAGNG